MTFRKIDDSAYAADKPLSSALGVWTAENNHAALETRTRAASFGFRATDPAVMAGFPVGTDGAIQRAVLPFLWRKSSPEITSLRVRVLVENGRAAYDCFVGGVVLRAGAAVGAIVPQNQAETTVTGSGRQIVSLTLDVSGLPHDTPLMVLLTCYGEVEPTEYWIYGDTSLHSGFDSATNMRLIVDAHGASDYWYNGTDTEAWADSVEPWVVEVGDNISAFTKQPDYSSFLMDRRLAIRFADSEIFVWPPMEDDIVTYMNSTLAASGYIVRRACGYIRVYGVEVAEVATAGDAGAAGYYSGSPNAAGAARALYGEGERVFSERGRCVAGPQFDPTLLDNADLSLNDYLQNPVTAPTQIGDGYLPVASAAWGNGDTFQAEGDGYVRTRAGVDLLYIGTCFPRGPEPLAYLAFRAVIGPSSGAVDDTGPDVQREVYFHPTKPDPGNPADWPGTYITFVAARFDVNEIRGRTACAGCYPEGLWPLMQWGVVTLDIKHSEKREEALIQVETKVEAWRDARRLILHRAALFVYDTPANWPEALGVIP